MYRKISITITVVILMLATIITPISLAIPRGHDVIGYNNEESSDDWDYPSPYQGFPNRNSFFDSGIKFRNNKGEYLIPDEYNLDTDGAGSYKWYPAEMIVCQSFIPDCSKIGAFGVQFKVKTHQYDPHQNLPDFRICLYPQTTDPYVHNDREYYLGPRPDVDKPIWTRTYSKNDADGWVGLEYGPNWQPMEMDPDGFYNLETQGYSPRYITVIPGKTYYIGIQLLGEHPRDICGGYSLETTGNRYSKGSRSDLEWNDPYNVGFPPNYNVHIDSDICFCVWGWDYPPEMPCDPEPEVGELIRLIKYGEDRPTPSPFVTPWDGKIGVSLSCLIDDPDDNLLEVFFYGALSTTERPSINPLTLIKDENLIGHRIVQSGKSTTIFWPDLVYAGDLPYAWIVVARDWGIQRLQCPRIIVNGGDPSAELAGSGVYYFYTLPYEEEEPSAPIVGDIPDQKVCKGENFDPINLNDYVQDDDPPEDIVWTFSGNTNLGIEIVQISGGPQAKISYHEDFIGSETITFTATDQDGLSDSDDATFTVMNCAIQNVTIVKEVRDYCGGEKYGKQVEVQLYDLVQFRLTISYTGEKPIDLTITDNLPNNLIYQYTNSENYTPVLEDANTLTWEFNSVEKGSIIEITFAAKAVDTGTGKNQAYVDSLEGDYAEDFATVVTYKTNQGDDGNDDYVPPDDDTPPCSTEVMITRPLEEQPFLYIQNKEKFPFMFNVVIGAFDINATVIDTCGQVTNVKFFIEEEEKANIPYNPTTPYYTYYWEDSALFWNTIEIAAYAGTQKIEGASLTIDVFALII